MPAALWEELCVVYSTTPDKSRVMWNARDSLETEQLPCFISPRLSLLELIIRLSSKHIGSDFIKSFALLPLSLSIACKLVLTLKRHPHRLPFMMILQSASLFLCLLFFKSTARALNLLDALRNSGASNFAASIEANSNIAALALSHQVQTVFAVPDDAFGSYVKRQKTPAEEQQLTLHFSDGLSRIGALNKRPGVIVSTQNKNAILGGKPQKVVTDTRNTTGSRVTMREAALLPRQSSNTTLQIPLSIFSGLGDHVSVTNGDIPYDGGVIHIVDG